MLIKTRETILAKSSAIKSSEPTRYSKVVINATGVAPCDSCPCNVKCKNDTVACGDFLEYVNGSTGVANNKKRFIFRSPQPKIYEAIYGKQEKTHT